MKEVEIKLFDKKKKVKMFKISDQPITRCNKNMDNMKENRKVLQLSLQYSNEEVVKD